MKGKDIPYKMFTFFTILYPSSIFNNYKIIRLLLLFWPSETVLGVLCSYCPLNPEVDKLLSAWMSD